MKDLFSAQAKIYAQFRPTYPTAFYDFIAKNVKETETAWDCGTGNGQVALALSELFTQVYATDISAAQLANAPQKDNIIYKVEPAEATDFADHTFDLITVAQAIHWFQFDAFFEEVKRALKPDGLFVAVGYGLLQINQKLDPIIYKLYKTILGGYWDEERKYIDENYNTIPFPLQEIKSPKLEILVQWDFEQLIGYLETWSALQHYRRTHKHNPIELIIDDLKNSWGDDGVKTIHFPLLIRAGKKQINYQLIALIG